VYFQYYTVYTLRWISVVHETDLQSRFCFEVNDSPMLPGHKSRPGDCYCLLIQRTAFQLHDSSPRAIHPVKMQGVLEHHFD